MTERRAASGTVPVRVVRGRDRASRAEKDELVAEEPLEIRVGETRFVVTMRTPGDDPELAVGLLFAEGILTSGEDVVRATRPEPSRTPAERVDNVAVVTLRAGLSIDRTAERRLPISSACGVCGKASIEEVLNLVARRDVLTSGNARIAASVLSSLPDALRRSQRVFAATGGLHAAGLFEPDGRLVEAREDVGRHNAVDKVIGARLLARREIPPILAVSGRLGFEIAQKAARAGIAILAAVGAPTSLAVELAEEAGMTLAGFVRDGGFNVYAHAERIDFAL